MMMGTSGRMVAAGLMILFLAAAPAAFGASHEGHDHGAMQNHGSMHDHGSHADGGSPLLEEMQQLDGAFREIVSGVALGDSGRVREAVESMHGSMEKTHKGLHGGKVTLPKSADKLQLFVKMDKDFHARLETLAQAARKNNQRKMLALTKQLLDGCVTCHQTFRK